MWRITTLMIALSCVLGAAPASDEGLHSFDEARIYYHPWDSTVTLAMRPESIRERAKVKVTLTGWDKAPRLAARMEIDRREGGVRAESTRDVRVRVDFMLDGKVVRSIFATDAVIYDDSGPLRRTDAGFKALFGALESLWLAPSDPPEGDGLGAQEN